MTQEEMMFEVTRGPGKFDLMVSLFEGIDMSDEPRRTVEFSLKDARHSIHVAIIGIEHENGSGESWNFKGRMGNVYLINGVRNFELEGYYNSRTRKGHFTFIVPFHYRIKGLERIKVELPADRRELEDNIKWIRAGSPRRNQF